MTDVDDLIKRLREHDAKLAARGFSASWVRGNSLSLEAADALQRMKDALEKIASCEMVCDGDTVDVARRALRGEGT